MHYSTKKWIFTKICSLILIPFIILFLISFFSIYDKGYLEIIEFFSSKVSKVLFSLLVVTAFFFYTLTISEIFEDYLHDEQTKNVANKVLNLFAIVVPILTIITIYNLN
jgi:succinate dehydrogenase / fumarate reductase membrane anchor subunit